MSRITRFFTGRKGQWKKIKSVFKDREQKDPLLWIHCASLGEFEQGRPVMEAFRKQHPAMRIVLTFFSPSGYDIRKNTPLADHVFYLPPDSPRNARRFLELIKPSLAVFVKYEFWYFYLKNLKKRNIPTYLISARFRPSQPFFKKYGTPFRFMLTCFTHLFVQDQSSRELLEKLPGLSLPVTVAGDTRFDRVAEIATHDNTPERFRQLIREPVLVAGSTWPQDEDILVRLLHDHPNMQLVLAPHEIHSKHLDSIRHKFEKWHPLFFSKIQPSASAPRVLVIDSIGMLSSLYRYATYCYIGGGFNKSGIHNALEAAVYGKPLLFGPNYHKFKEACDLVDKGAAVGFQDYSECSKALKKWMDDPGLYPEAANAAKTYVAENTGATALMLQKMAVPEP
ncbi:MAG TPA: glycosyltransferase N-terminal domain-containing protein [Bacteroidales bacterium]|nr:glycosyltransferase N-terminal domain-containing protein [Bacteroidales bacterium]HPQ56529.1 glycosyltransferase N-terminal domain-containing protein [Bacteroidales bacterium]